MELMTIIIRMCQIQEKTEKEEKKRRANRRML